MTVLSVSNSKFFLKKNYKDSFIYHVCIYRRAHACHGMLVKVRGHLLGVSSLLPHGLQGLNLGFSR